MSALLDALLRPEAYDHPVAVVQVIETHISWVLLTGEVAYKLRKPINLGFVDFSTPERRRWFSQEELRLNQRLAPDLYLDWRPVFGPSSQATLRGPGEEIDTVVRMRQFPQEQLLQAVLARDGLQVALLERLAEDLARFHAGAAVASATSPFGQAAAVIAPAMANLQVLEPWLADGPSGLDLPGWTRAEAQRLGPTFEDRRLQGAIREGHGDLHLGNMVLLGDRITVFDCLEFSPPLRWIDPISDLAFLVMDLRQRGRPDFAGVVLDQWLLASGDYGGLRCWRWYLVYRALVRAKVAALGLGQTASPALIQSRRQDLDRYRQLAVAMAGSGVGRLTICHGVSGSGKSQLARRICGRLGWIRLCSDIERRRLFGRWGRLLPAEPLDGDPYRAAVSEQLYGVHLLQAAEQAILAGESVLVDATFLRRRDRWIFQQLARRHGAPFRILDCRIDRDLARARLTARRQQGLDPSEADGAVLDAQWEQRDTLSAVEVAHCLCVDTSTPLEGERWERLLADLQG